MNPTYRNTTLFLLCFFSFFVFSTTALAQFSKATVPISREKKNKKGTKLYERFGYKAYIEFMHNLNPKKQKGIDRISKMAKSYLLNGDYESAALWYNKIIYHTKNSEDYLNYAISLQSSGKCNDAQKWLVKYRLATPDKKTLDLADCSAIENLPIWGDIKIKNLTEINSEHLDFCPVPYGKGIVFTSTRGIEKMVKHHDIWTKDNFSDLYYVERSMTGTYSDAVPLKGGINGVFHDGVATFSKDQKTMIFTRTNKVGRSRKGVKRLKIYQAENIDGEWKNIVELPFNNNEYSNCHPSLSEDGNTLFFSSDRPGGFGGMDIYVATRKDGTWSAPKNVGDLVNTSGNEVFPFISYSGQLYFASSGHEGFGGLDLFFVDKNEDTDEDDPLLWDKIENLGLPFNSEKDDFGMLVNRDGYTGYFSSNRGKGKNDNIYAWESKGARKFKLPNNLYVFDEDSKRRIFGAQVYLGEQEENDKHESLLKRYETNQEGIIQVKINPDNSYTLTIEKEGFESKEINISGEEINNEENYGISLKKIYYKTMNGLVIDKETKVPLPNTQLRVLNTTSQKMETLQTDANGKVMLKVQCNCHHTIIATKDGYLFNESDLSFEQQECLPSFSEKSGEFLIALTKIPEKELELKKHFLGDEKKDFEKGQTIVLRNLYYDFDKYNIRPDASIQLDKLVELLEYYPEMEVKLLSHTDSKGKAAYNQRLSQKRAQAAVDYITAKGISRSRIQAVGYGESQLVNGCKDGVECSEQEHQENRRTEIQIIKFDRPNVNIEIKK